MPAKRKATKAAGGKKGSKQPKSEDQEAVVPKKIVVPVDEGFRGVASPSVYIDDDTVIYDASLNQTDVRNNNNKFYRIQLIEAGGEYWHHNRWGRLGEFGQMSSSGPGDLESMLKEFNKKFKDKTGLKWEDRKGEPKPRKYTYLERNYEDDDDDEQDGDGKGKGKEEASEAAVKEEEQKEEFVEPESKLEPAVKKLVELIFDENNFNATLSQLGYNQDKLPLGKLSKETLMKGFSYLQELEELIGDTNLAQTKHSMTHRQALEHFSNRYYSTIPHVGRNKRQALPVLDSLGVLKNEIDMLDNLTNMGITNEIMQATRQRMQQKQKEQSQMARLDKQFEQLGLSEATPLDSKSTEYELLAKYLVNTSGHTHHFSYKIHDIFRIDRRGEAERFKEEYGSRKDSYRRLLWHGSRTTNYGGILSQGLRIAPPEAPVSGYVSVGPGPI